MAKGEGVFGPIIGCPIDRLSWRLLSGKYRRPLGRKVRSAGVAKAIKAAKRRAKKTPSQARDWSWPEDVNLVSGCQCRVCNAVMSDSPRVMLAHLRVAHDIIDASLGDLPDRFRFPSKEPEKGTNTRDAVNEQPAHPPCCQADGTVTQPPQPKGKSRKQLQEEFTKSPSAVIAVLCEFEARVLKRHRNGAPRTICFRRSDIAKAISQAYTDGLIDAPARRLASIALTASLSMATGPRDKDVYRLDDNT